ncbi:hypothetical protein [Paenibacillus sp. NPDC058071]|uniref:hypothetical protein n=1 Tax=Paenibacillus sp. NPDC058071 TaxID=3346326 RepID=UPI0036DB1BFF
MISPFFKKKDTAGKPIRQEAAAEGAEEQLTDGQDPEELEEAVLDMSSINANKANLDKKSLDLVFAVEQIIQARQHAEMNIQELQDRLNHANGHVERLNRDVKNLNKVIDEREKSIRELENKLIEKNLKVDQVMEDYRELQSAMSVKTEELQSVIDLEQQKYTALLQKHNETNAAQAKRVTELEEKIGRLEAEGTHMRQKYETIRQEKNYLSDMINEFTNRMAAPFGQASSGSANTKD